MSVLKKITIGGIDYSVSCEDNIPPDKCLELFIKAGDTRADFDCRLTVIGHKTKLAVQKLQSCSRGVFEADTTWGLYGKQKTEFGSQSEQPFAEIRIGKLEIILTVPSLKNGGLPQLFAKFDKDFKHGDVHVDKTGAHYFLYPFLEVLTINLLGRGNGLLVHACCVDDNGKGYLFIGQSGAGKSTMADLWNGKEGVRVLSDDRVIVQRSGKDQRARFVAHGTPWHGTANYAMNASVPIEKIFLIRHAEKNSVVPVKGMRPVTALIRDSFLPFWDRDGMEYSVGFIDQIARHIDLFELGFVPGAEAVNFIKNM